MAVPVKAGYLSKLSSNFSHWNRRYFVLVGSTMFYSKTEDDMYKRKFSGEITLSGAQIAIYPASNELFKQFEDHTYLFGIKTAESDRIYVLDAENQKAQAEWVACLQHQATLPKSSIPDILCKDPSSIREGFLKKKGEIVTSWKVRYFVLKGNYLAYYRSVQDNVPAGSVLLLGTTTQIEPKALDSSLQNCFSLARSDGKRTYYIQASSKEEAEDWVVAIQKQSVFSNESGSSAQPVATSMAFEDQDKDANIAAVANALATTETPGDGLASSGFAHPLANHLSSAALNIKQKVSKKKRRFVTEEFDLDLTYITEKIIAMGFPAENMEAMYRNSMSDVQRFLDTRHPDAYRVYNLCSERDYDPAKFHHNVCRFPFDDHNCPNFEDLIPLCEDIHNWLSIQNDHVVAVHCKAGKGRTGLVVATYLLYSGAWLTARDALQFYGFVRTKDQKGVTIPSQKRYVQYFEIYLKNPEVLSKHSTLTINEMYFEKGMKTFDSVSITNFGHKYNSKDWGKYWKETLDSGGILLQLPQGQVVVNKDFKIELFVTGLLGKKTRVAQVWLHTAFINDDYAELQKSEIDKCNKEKELPNFSLQMYFNNRRYEPGRSENFAVRPSVAIEVDGKSEMYIPPRNSIQPVPFGNIAEHAQGPRSPSALARSLNVDLFPESANTSSLPVKMGISPTSPSESANLAKSEGGLKQAAMHKKIVFWSNPQRQAIVCRK